MKKPGLEYVKGMSVYRCSVQDFYHIKINVLESFISIIIYAFLLHLRILISEERKTITQVAGSETQAWKSLCADQTA
jgi:hypothetical protein